MKTSYVAALGVAAVVAACGGGGESASPFPPATTQVPPSASASTDGFISYLVALVASPADTLEPVDTSGVTPPTDEVSEPQKVD
jgi:hypothetical protein